MKLYAESSAVLTWLLGQPGADDVAGQLAAATVIVSSRLTVLECERVLVRLAATDAATEVELADRRSALHRAVAHWNLLSLDDEITERASRAFPAEPVRTLDAVHLASALIARARVSGLCLLTLDQRLRDNGRALGFEILPT